MRQQLQEKVIVVTGSTRGIGRGIAEALAAEGAAVVICSRDEAAVAEAVQTLLGRGFRVLGMAADVSSPADIERLLRHSVERWGRVDVWVNNAGLSGGFRPVDGMPPEAIDRVVAVNLAGTIHACRLLVPFFVQQGGGILINMGGRGGRGNPSPFMAVLAATKAAVLSFTRSLAEENRDNPISVHAVLPGMVATDFYTKIETTARSEATTRSLPYVLRAMGVPVEEVGRLFVKIASQEPGAVTGKTYSLLKGWRLVRGIALLSWYRATGKIPRK